MNPVIVSLTLSADDDNGLVTSETLSGAGDLTLDGALVSGGVGTLDSGGAARRVAITSSGDDTGVVWTVVGTDFYGNPQTDTFPGVDTAAAVSNYDFKTVTQISGSAATDGDVIAGTNATGSTPWFFVSREMTPFSVSFACDVPSGNTETVEWTYDDPNMVTVRNGGYDYGSTAQQSHIPPVVWTDTSVSGKTASFQTGIATPAQGAFYAFRLTTTAGTGTATLWATQAGIDG